MRILHSFICRHLLLVLFSCSSPVTAQLLDDPLEQFPEPQANFQLHIEEVRAYLLDTQLEQRQPGDVEYNVPFELLASAKVPFRGKYLLIHGLNDSPAVWHDVAISLAQRGFDVRAILLPGHGNTPEAQLNVSYLQWLTAARAQLEYWRSPDVPFYLGGFSLGGVIATILALENDDIDGLFLFAPAYYSSKAGLLRWASLVSYVKPWVFGGMIIEDNPTKYNSIPINAAAQYYKTAKYLQRSWDKKENRTRLTMPVLMVESLDDSVVNVDATRHIFASRFTSAKRRLVLYGHEESRPGEYEIIRPGRYPELRILNQSHMGLMLSPQNSLFGKKGTQLVCNGNEWKVFSGCLYHSGGTRWRGAEGTESPDGVPVARTTYNPDFEDVMALHDQVFAAESQ